MKRALVALLIACGGGANTPPPAEPAIVLAEARKRTDAALPDGLATSVDELRKAAETAPQELAIAGHLQRAIGLAALLYAIPNEPLDPARFATDRQGWRDHVVGQVAFELSRAKDGKAIPRLATLLDDELARDASDPWLHWLRARVALLAGDRTRAAAELDVAVTAKHTLAGIDRAVLAAEAGEVSDSLARLEAPELAGHPLARVARATIRAEAAAGLAAKGWGDDAPADQLARAYAQLGELHTTAPAIVAHREVAGMLMALAAERYDQVAASLEKLGSTRALPMDCGLWKRIAWAHVELARGTSKHRPRSDFRTASVTRTRCAFPAPGLEVVDAALQLALGRPEQARARVARSEVRWARVIEAEAALELGDPRAALEAVRPALASGSATDKRPVTHAARVVEHHARAVLGKGKEREAALAELARLADVAKTQRARQALGAAYLAIGDHVAAKRELRRAATETSIASPDPHGVRTRTLLAEIAFAEGDVALATQELQQALAIHEANQPAKVLQAKLALRANDPEQALAVLASQRKLGGLTPAAELVVAEALVVRKEVTADQRAQARLLVEGLVGKPAIVPAELGRVAALVDPALPRRLALPVGKLPGGGT